MMQQILGQRPFAATFAPQPPKKAASYTDDCQDWSREDGNNYREAEGQCHEPWQGVGLRK